MKGYIILFLVITIIFFSYIFYQILYDESHRTNKIFDVAGKQRELKESFKNVEVAKPEDLIKFFKTQASNFYSVATFFDDLTKSLRDFNKKLNS